MYSGAPTSAYRRQQRGSPFYRRPWVIVAVGFLFVYVALSGAFFWRNASAADEASRGGGGDSGADVEDAAAIAVRDAAHQGLRGGTTGDNGSMSTAAQAGSGAAEPVAAGTEPNMIAGTPSAPAVAIASGAVVDHGGIDADEEKRDAVLGAFKHAWSGYTKYAWGRDRLKPVSRTGDNDGNFEGMGLTIVDALDTLWIMGMREDFAKARDWIATEFSCDHQEGVNLFEMTIRVIGGLLSAYDLSGDAMFLEKAQEGADRLIVAFDSPSGLPYGTVGLKSHKKYNPSWASRSSTMSEVASLQLEWEYLSHATGDPKYSKAVRRVMTQLHSVEPSDSLYPMFVKPDTGQLSGSSVTLGARGDSLYEYLLKQVLQMGPASQGPTSGSQADRDHVDMLWGMYQRSMKGVEDVLLHRSSPGDYLYVRERYGTELRDKMDHLVCFVPGMLALGAVREGVETQRGRRHLSEARDIMRTCHRFYEAMPTGLAPEICKFPKGSDPVADQGAKHSLLRPETVESLFVMWRVTKDPVYRQWGWDIFQAIEKHARVQTGGYSSIKDVTQDPPTLNDSMESFFLAETLKYLYLLFSDGAAIPLDRYVFNTEAHPLSIFPQE